jgi:hypothetical protein
MGERRQVAACSDGTAARNPRQETEVQALDEQLGDLHPRAGATCRQRVRSQQERRPHDLVRVRLADTAGVTPQQSHLQLIRELRRDRLRHQPAEPGVDAVGALWIRGGALDHFARGAHPLLGLLGHGRGRAADGHLPDVFDREGRC